MRLGCVPKKNVYSFLLQIYCSDNGIFEMYDARNMESEYMGLLYLFEEKMFLIHFEKPWSYNYLFEAQLDISHLLRLLPSSALLFFQT